MFGNWIQTNCQIFSLKQKTRRKKKEKKTTTAEKGQLYGGFLCEDRIALKNNC